MITHEEARSAKHALIPLLEGVGAAVGITRVGDDYVVTVRVAYEHNLPMNRPEEVNGVPIIYEVIGKSRAMY